MSRSWTNSPEREFTSREQASAFYACLIWCREWTRRLKTGQAMTTIEDVCREAVERSQHAKLAELSEESGELDYFSLRELADSESVQPTEAGDGEVPSNRAGRVPAFLLEEAGTFDRLVSELERGEG